QVQFGPDPMGLLRNYVPGNKKLPIAVRVSGDIKSAFEKAPEGVATQTHLGQSKEKVNVIVVADTDMLTDRMWVNVQNFFGQKLIIPSANNDAFLLNAVENLAGSNDLISLRSRDRSIRPFTKVLELKQEAETQFRDTEAKLQEKLRTAERKLNELQQKKDGGNSLILSSEQQAELERFREEQVKTRRELRQVQHALGKNIEDLGSWLKFINIALMPILIVIVALSFLYYRNKRLREAEA
ncbi:MAG: hypothetical protein OEZ47_06560, partial [Gammaproteobacteria bacterium]|nr:hypothetical protein [Gammaproteobacteria bacterium]